MEKGYWEKAARNLGVLLVSVLRIFPSLFAVSSDANLLTIKLKHIVTVGRSWKVESGIVYLPCTMIFIQRAPYYYIRWQTRQGVNVAYNW